MPPASNAPKPIALIAAFLGCALIWGSTFLVISIGNDTVPPIWAAVLRLLVAGPLLLILSFATGHRLPGGAAFRTALIYGLLNFGINFALLYWGETHVPSGLAAVLYATIPLSSTLLTRAFGLEKITVAKVLAASVALVGVFVIFSGRLRSGVSLGPLGAVLFAATLAGFSVVILKRGPRQNPVAANAVAALGGLLVCVPASFLAGEAHPIPTAAAQWGPIVYLAVMGSVGAFVLMAWLVNHWDVTRISFVSVIVPVVALLLGATVRGERIGAAGWLGSALVIAGVGLRIYSDRRALKESAPASG